MEHVGAVIGSNCCASFRVCLNVYGTGLGSIHVLFLFVSSTRIGTRTSISFVPVTWPYRRLIVREQTAHDTASLDKTVSMHRLAIKARFGELDPYNHVNHSVYVAWFEAGRGEALESLGIGLPELADQGYQFVVSTLNVNYRISAKAGELLVVETELGELGGATSIWQQRLVRETRGDVDHNEPALCTAEIRAAFCNTAGKPTRFPPKIREQLLPLVRT
jgi:YbgC/YbaW family acyl-CoA thioester hydrolase